MSWNQPKGSGPSWVASGSAGGGSWTPPGGTEQVSFNRDLITGRLRRAIGRGDTKRVRQIARDLNLKPRDTKALVAATLMERPPGFTGRLTRDIGETISGTAKGLPAFAATAGLEAIAPVRAGYLTAKGEELSGFERLTAIPFIGNIAGGIRTLATGEPNKLLPGSTEMAMSFRRTGARVADPGRLAREYSERPFSTFVEDVGNVAVVGAAATAAAKAAAGRAAAASATAETAGNTARAAQLAQRAARLSAIARRGGQITNTAEMLSNTPFLPVSLPARGLNLALTGGTIPESRLIPEQVRGVQVRGREVPGITGAKALQGVMTTLRLTPEIREVKRLLREAQQDLGAMADLYAKPFSETQRRLLPDLDEQRAMYLTAEGLAPALARAKELLPEETFDQIAQSIETKYPRRSVDLAIEAYTGRDAGLQGRIGQALEEVIPIARRRQEGYLSRGGEGRAEQTGYRPLTGVVQARTARQQAQVLRRERLVARRQQILEGVLKRQNEQVARRLEKFNAKRRPQIEAYEEMLRTQETRRQLLPQLAAARRNLREVSRTVKLAFREYQALDRQYFDARRADPNYSGLRSLNAERLAAYQRYSDLLTERAQLQRQVSELRAAVPDAAIRVPATKLLTPEQVAKTMPITGELRVAQRNLGRAMKSLETQSRKLQKEFAEAEASLEATPARLRPLLAVNRQVAEAIRTQRNQLRGEGLESSAVLFDEALAELPETLALLEQNGIDVAHIINPGAQRAPRTGAAGRLQLPRRQRRAESRRRTGMGEEYDMTLRAQAQEEIFRASQTLQEDLVNKIAQLPFVKNVRDLANMTDADGQLLFPNLNVDDPSTYPTRAQLNENGLEIWAPSQLFGTAKRPASDVPVGITPDTVILPKPVFDAFRSYYQPQGTFAKILSVTLDPFTAGFKILVLPLTPAWNIGNAVTNAFMATFVAGVDPITLARSIKEAIGVRRRTGEWAGPPRLFQSGSAFETSDFLRTRDFDTPSRLRRALTAPVRAGFGINQAVDNMYRSAVYVAKTKKYSPEVSLKLALRAMGDFTNMSPFERNIVRRVIPFYAWVRQMTLISTRLPIEHPYRTAWILSMSNAFRDSEAWESILPGFMRGFLPLGGDTVLGTQNYMPFAQPLTVTNMWRNLNPAFKLLLTNVPGTPLQGINPLTGRPYTRPPGTGRFDEFGRPLPTAPSLINQLRDLAPQIRLIDTARGRDDIARYDSGDPIRVRDENGKLKYIKVPESTLRNFTQFAGFPVKSKKTLKDIADTIIERRVEQWKSANPQTQLDGSSGGGGSGGWKPPSSTGTWKPPRT